MANSPPNRAVANSRCDRIMIAMGGCRAWTGKEGGIWQWTVWPIVGLVGNGGKSTSASLSEKRRASDGRLSSCQGDDGSPRHLRQC